jgi:hypothetical protein
MPNRGVRALSMTFRVGALPVKVDVSRLVGLPTQGTPEAAAHWSRRKMGAKLSMGSQCKRCGSMAGGYRLASFANCRRRCQNG